MAAPDAFSTHPPSNGWLYTTALMVALLWHGIALADDRRGALEPPLSGPDGRHAYSVFCDGRVDKVDRVARETVATFHADARLQRIAVSSDGDYVTLATDFPYTLLLLDGNLRLRASLPITSYDGQLDSGVTGIYEAPPRRSLVVMLRDVPEIWEISLDPDAEPIATGFIHDHRMREGVFIPGYLNPRRTLLDRIFETLVFSEDFSLMRLSGADHPGQIVSLDARRRLADLPLDTQAHPALAISWLPLVVADSPVNCP